MTLNELLRQQPVQWHGVKLNAPDWSHESHTLAATARLLGDGVMLHVMNNAYWEPLAFEIPLLTPLYGSWQRIIDTSLESPEDIATSAIATTVQGPTCLVQPRSLVILMCSRDEVRAHARIGAAENKIDSQ